MKTVYFTYNDVFWLSDVKEGEGEVLVGDGRGQGDADVRVEADVCLGCCGGRRRGPIKKHKPESFFNK